MSRGVVGVVGVVGVESLGGVGGVEGVYGVGGVVQVVGVERVGIKSMSLSGNKSPANVNLLFELIVKLTLNFQLKKIYICVN